MSLFRCLFALLPLECLFIFLTSLFCFYSCINYHKYFFLILSTGEKQKEYSKQCTGSKPLCTSFCHFLLNTLACYLLAEHIFFILHLVSMDFPFSRRKSTFSVNLAHFMHSLYFVQQTAVYDFFAHICYP